MKADDIITGELSCKKCRRRFPIKNGIAILLSESNDYRAVGQLRYEESTMTDRYLWSHYGDLLGLDDYGDAHTHWAAALSCHPSLPSFDAGCAVGRLTFEMAVRSSFAVGCDLSHGFVKAARRLARDGEMTFSLPQEGNLRESFTLTLPESLRSDTIEFVVADALRIPFAANSFSQVASLNLLDRVSYPLAHLFEMSRVADNENASFLFADPFSWSPDVTPEEFWLGGTTTGPYQGRGLDNVRSILEGKGNILKPAWSISRSGTIPWNMRTHCNHCEVIRSQYLVAAR